MECFAVNPFSNAKSYYLPLLKTYTKMEKNIKNGLGKDAVMRPLSGEEETSILAPKPAKDKKRKKTSISEDPESKKKADRKPKKNIILLIEDSVRRLREEEEEEEENDSRLVARVGMSTEALKATESVKAAETPSRDEGVLGRDFGEVPESSRIEDASHHNEPTQKVKRIEQYREEINMMKAETLGWKEGMDRFTAKKETTRAQLSLVESQLRDMKEKSSAQAREHEADAGVLTSSDDDGDDDDGTKSGFENEEDLDEEEASPEEN
ncbi:uncharacterized protein [Nicotiana tomentosiformis]|uniref:uncharacterized protein n=1 Tax=Nicotiana tomentosiformis TaxID=4098 RepID=UPI00388CDC1D